MISKGALALLFLLCACGAAASFVIGRRKRAETAEKTQVQWATDDAPYRYSEQKDEPLKPPRSRPDVLSRGLDALAELIERVHDFYSNLSERGRKKALFVASAIGLCILVIVSAIVLFRKRTLEATVTFGSWENVVHVARYAIYFDNGFDVPQGAFDVKSEGTRFHHYDRVFDHMEDQTSTSWQSCGTNCVGTVCTPKQCLVTMHQEVPVYRDEPVYRSYYIWRRWEWRHNRDVKAVGLLGQDIRWPSEEEVALGKRVDRALGEDEKTSAESFYLIRFVHRDDVWSYKPKTLEEFKRFKLGGKSLIRVSLLSGILTDVEILY